jgi:hypothetical protein
MEEKIEERVKIVGNAKIASYLLRQGYKITNIKKYRDFVCPFADVICEYRTAFAFLVDSDDFWRDYFYAKDKYDDIGIKEE